MSVSEPSSNGSSPAQAPFVAGYGAPVPAARVVPGFTGVPAADYVRDVAAVVLLLVSLGLPWNWGSNATGHLEVVLITVLSVLSVSAHYLYRAGVFPPAWPARTVGLLRAVLNVPYLVIVVIVLVTDLVAVLGGSHTLTLGVGAAAFVGSAGAVLAATPRAGELDASAMPVVQTRLRMSLWVLGGFGLLLQLLGLISPLLTHAYEGSPAMLVVYHVVGTLGVAAVVGWVLLAAGRGEQSWRLVLVVVGVSIVAWTVLVTQTFVVSVSAGDLGLVVLPAAAMLGSVGFGPVADQREYGRTVAMHAFAVTALVAGVTAACAVPLLGVNGGYLSVGTLVTLLVLSLITVVAALVGRSSLAGPTRMTALAAWGVIVVVGVVMLAVQGSTTVLASSWNDGLSTFGLPLLGLWALVLPAAGRTFPSLFRAAGVPFSSAQPATPSTPSPVMPSPVTPNATVPPVGLAPTGPTPPVPPVPPAPPAPVTAHGFTAAQASDPGTDPAVLMQIAAQAPELRSLLAANPATYPSLLQWLRDLHDPQVDDVLRTRG